MKKAIIIVILFLKAVAMVGQPIINSSHLAVGKNLISGNEIGATQYEFQDRIYNWQYDSTFHALTLQLRGIKDNGKYYKPSGDLTLFDLKSKKLLWSKEVNYRTTEINQYASVLLLNNGLNSTSRLSVFTGAPVWEADIVVFATFPDLNILLGYKYNSFTQELSKKLCCVDLSTGNILWERPVDKGYGWNGVDTMNDSTLLIKSSGLYQVNIKTGKGWQYEAKTGVKDYSKTIGANVAGALLGVLTGTYVVSTGHDLVSNLVSNVSADSLCLYFASKDRLTCLSQGGEVKWEVNLPAETSHSYLLMDSNRIVLINEGEADYNGKKYAYGKSYIAVFDKKNGSQQHLSIFEGDKNPLLEYVVSNDSVELYFKDKVIGYSLNNGNYATINLNTDQIGEMVYPVAMDRIYLQSDSCFQTLHSSAPRAMFMMSSKNNLVKIGRNLTYEKNISLDGLYAWQGKAGSYTFLSHNNKLIVLNSSMKQIAELNISKNIFIYDNHLYEIGANTITDIDLSVLM